MSAEERRAAVVKAALPLVIEYGSAVTTKQIATAAGIAEGTIFRAFEDKDAVVDACIVEALRPDQVIADVGAISLDRPLAERLTEAAEAVQAHMGRIGSVMRALHLSGPVDRRRGRPDPDGKETQAGGERGGGERGGRRPGRHDRQESVEAIHAAVAELFEPDRDSLRLSPEQLAEVFLRVAFVDRRRAWAKPTQLEMKDLIELFLNGAIAHAEGGAGRGSQ